MVPLINVLNKKRGLMPRFTPAFQKNFLHIQSTFIERQE
jgi:hypothetical protein